MSRFSVGGAIGPMLGGVLLAHFGWGAVFLLAVPVMVLLLAVGPRLLPEFRDPAPGRLDVVSAGLSIVAVLGVIFGVKRIAASGLSAFSAAVVVASALVGVVFVRRQRHLARPLLDLALFRIRPFAVSLTVYVLGAFAAFGTFLTVAQYLQLVRGLSALEAGLWTAPSGAAFILGSLAGPALLRWFRKVHVMAAGLAVAALGAVLLARLDPHSTMAMFQLGYLLFGFGLSLSFTHAVDLVVSAAPPERAGAASALAETGAELGGAVGIAILGSIGTFVYRGSMLHNAPTGTPAEAVQSVGGAVAVAKQHPAGPAILDSAHAAFFHSLSITATICAVALLAASVATLWFLGKAPRA